MSYSLLRQILAVVLVLSFTGYARGEVQAAKEYLKSAQELIDSNDYAGAAAKLDLAEAELDGVEAGAKAPLAGALAEARQKVQNANAAVDHQKYKRKLDWVMTEVEGAIGNLAAWPGDSKAVEELLNDPAAKTALGGELDAAAKKYATFKKLNAKKMAPQIAEEISTVLNDLDTRWAEAKAKLADPNENAKDSIVQDAERTIASARQDVKRIAGDDERVGKWNARIDKVAAEFTQIALADRVKEVVVTLNRKSELYKNDWDGYEKETAGPSWKDYRALSSEDMSAFLAPKTRVFISRADELLASLADDEEYKSVQADPAIKAIVTDVKNKRDAAYARMLKFVQAVVKEASASDEKDALKLGRLKDDVRLALGEKSPEGLEMYAQLDKKIRGNATEVAGDEEARTKLIEMLRAKATESWPMLQEGIEVTPDHDLSHPENLKGKAIAFTSDNLAGYHFKPSDFYFATTIGGIPVAGSMNPQLMKQIRATEKAIGRGLGDDDGDGKWEVVAVVTDRKTKLLAKRSADSTVTVDGEQAKVTTDYAEPVDAVVIEIIAAKCGPFAGSKDRGVLQTDGKIGK